MFHPRDLALALFAISFHAMASDLVAIPPTTQRAIAFSRDANLLWLAGRMFLLGIPAVLLFTGVATRLRRTLTRIARGNRFWMFHTYKPLENERLRAMIAALAARARLPDTPIVQSDGDASDSCGVACVTGLGPSRRIVISDTALAHYSEREMRSIVSHEMKHYIKDDNVKAFVVVSALLLVGLWLADRLGRVAVERWKQRFGFSELSDPASIPLLVLCVTLVYVAADPLFLAYARHVEFEADRFGLELAQDNRAAAMTFVKDAQLAPIASEPGWFATVFRENHPSIAERIKFANAYHPWRDGKPLVYGDDFVKNPHAMNVE